MIVKCDLLNWKQREWVCSEMFWKQTATECANGFGNSDLQIFKIQ
jgi:hypothetical protein